MSDYQTNMYRELMVLTQTSEAFYSTDFTLDECLYRIFNYRLASYTDFLMPSALECRGHMFRVSEDGVELVSLPMAKFFNLNENPFTMNLDLSKVDNIELKADGSLISTYLHLDRVKLKSKGSLSSEQALASEKWLYLNDQAQFLKTVEKLVREKYTVNMEYCAPDNRIVIGYEFPHLKVLNVRSQVDGSYMSRCEVEQYFDKQYLIERVDMGNLDKVAFVQSIPAMQDNIEGYIIRIGDLWCKIKTDKYVSLHHTKDSVNNPRRLFEAVLDEGVDDLRSMFFEDKLMIKLIDEMTEKVDKIYNHMVSAVEKFYTDNKHLDRKDYAIKGQQELEPLYFSLVMNLYVGRKNDYKQYCKDKWKSFGLKDEPQDIQ